jgi:sugar/nucleoside kinase (ribokinase family)
LIVDYKKGLLNFLEEKPEKCNVIVMPDFFLDRLISLNYDMPHFSSLAADIAKRKGGSIDGVEQVELRGGNAINTASALAALGIQVTPIVCTNKLGLQQLKFHLEKYCIDLSHVKMVEKASLTTALELRMENGKANVMLRDLGSLEDFGPSDLSKTDNELIESADFVCLFNWAGTKRCGTALAEAIFQRTKTKGKGKTYYDTADPTPNREKIPKLMEDVLKTDNLDILSLNENEAICYASQLNPEVIKKNDAKPLGQSAMEAGRVLARHLPARVDLHTTTFSATFNEKNEIVIPAFNVKAIRATGAGDSWNAGNIIGYNDGLSDESRLTLANAVAAYYISDPDGNHPTRQDLIRFFKKHPTAFPR